MRTLARISEKMKKSSTLWTFVSEIKEKVNYAHVINMHLNRIAAIRTKLFITETAYDKEVIGIGGILEYIASVEALQCILLPELRGESEKYLRLARKLASVLFRILFSKTNNRGQIKPLLTEVPENLRKKFSSALTDLHSVAFIIDKALEEMLINLNKAGLLLEGKPLKTGTVRGD